MKKKTKMLKVLLALIPFILIGTAVWFLFGEETNFIQKTAQEIKDSSQNIIGEVNAATPQKTAITNITVQDKKARFRDTIVPAVNDVYAELMSRYLDVSEAVKSGKNVAKLEALRKEYKAANNAELLMALKPHPKSIVIAQAAMESAWGTSRFFNEAKNIFGVWSFDKNEPRISAGKKRGNKTIWVKKYPSVKAAIRDYYRTIARGHAFKEFRKLKMKTNDPHALVKKLDRYSEKGEKYGQALSAIIKFNKFGAYDTAL